ncbi:MAG: glycerol-3-phosphate acyltransferase, partial [Nanopusillaceae archaeon]
MMEFFISYLLGSINFSWIIGKIFGIDISKKNDENLGATNLYYAALNKYKNRKLSFFLFLFSGFLDLLKA